MNNDPIVASVRRVREELAGTFDFDVHAIFADLRKRESQLGDRLVYLRHAKESNKPIHPSGDGAVSDSEQPTSAAATEL